MKLLAPLSLALAVACGPRPTGPGPARESTAEAGQAATHARRAECTLAATGCHGVDECHGRGICEAAPPTSDYGCGIPPHRVESCKADADCKSGEVCNPYVLGCEAGHRCEARCDTAGCQDGWACRADGRCSARRCPDEWSCADYGTCKPPQPGEGPLQGGRDWHGCMPLACKGDGDCPCAHCVNSSCTPIPGRCIEARG